MNPFEKRTFELLQAKLPCCALFGVTLYRPDRFGADKMHGFEIDNLLHWQSGDEDRLVILECKDAPVRVANVVQSIPPQNQEWFVPTPNGQKNLKDQIFNQAEALWQNLCVWPSPHRRIEAFIVSTERATPTLKCKVYSGSGLTIHLLSETEMVRLLNAPAGFSKTFEIEAPGSFLRVAQSDLLRIARQNVVVPELGHPEIDHAIEMIRRCRQSLDGRLFDFFQPRDRRWAINGSAGMGKSVLLAYSLTVFACGKMLHDSQQGSDRRTIVRTELVDHLDPLLKLPPLNGRRILVLGLKERQLKVLRHLWTDFLNRFRSLSGYLPHVHPEFHLWPRPKDLSLYDIIFVDEAHDLPNEAQAALAEWWNQPASGHYLVIACDRHQKLRLSEKDDEKWMIRGIPFAGCSKRLIRNYRNPTPIYCAALALMFRWFAPAGPKVLPTKSEFVNSFGLTPLLLDRRKDGRVEMEVVNDAHPGNHWRFTITRVQRPTAAQAWLLANSVKPEDVLWVRFGPQDEDIDYQELSARFTYKTLTSRDSDATIDAEIKGQEFPVVVIEGFPPDFDGLENPERGWVLRRQVYLCASRATAFLFFVLPSTGSSVNESGAAVSRELDTLLAALSAPSNPEGASTKMWRFSFDLPESPIAMDVFHDEEEEPAESSLSEAQPQSVNLPAQATVEGSVTSSNAELPARAALAIADEPAGIATVPRGSVVASMSVEKIQMKEASADPEPIRGASIPATGRLEVLNGADQRDSGRPVPNAVAASCPPMPTVVSAANGAPLKEGVEPVRLSEHTSSVLPLSAGPPGSTPVQAAPPSALSEKDFQRLYGDQQGWKDWYYRYLNSGVMPTHKSRTGHVSRQTPATVPISEKSILPKARNDVTPRMLALHLGVMPHKIIKAALERATAQHDSYFPTLDGWMPPSIAMKVCTEFGAALPEGEDLVRIRKLAAQPKTKDSKAVTV